MGGLGEMEPPARIIGGLRPGTLWVMQVGTNGCGRGWALPNPRKPLDSCIRLPLAPEALRHRGVRFVAIKAALLAQAEALFVPARIDAGHGARALECHPGPTYIGGGPLGWAVESAVGWVVRGSASGGSADYVRQRSERVTVAGSRKERHVGAASRSLANPPMLC
jgi:hypothetical protein